MSFHLNIAPMSLAARPRVKKKLGLPVAEIGVSLVAVSAVIWALSRCAPTLW